MEVIKMLTAESFCGFSKPQASGGLSKPSLWSLVRFNLKSGGRHLVKTRKHCLNDEEHAQHGTFLPLSSFLFL